MQAKLGILKRVEQLPWEIQLLSSKAKHAYQFVSNVCRTVFCGLLLTSQYETTLINWNTLQTVAIVKHAMAVHLRLGQWLLSSGALRATENPFRRPGSVATELLRQDHLRRVTLYHRAVAAPGAGTLGLPAVAPKVYAPMQTLRLDEATGYMAALRVCHGRIRLCKSAPKQPPASPAARPEDARKALVRGWRGCWGGEKKCPRE